MSFWGWLEGLLEAKDDPLPKHADVAIGIGIDVSASGLTASPQSLAVANMTARFWETGRASNVLLVGGYKLGSGATESELMWAAIRHRVPLDYLYLEKESVRTWQNADSAREIMEKNGWDTAVIVTQQGHARRVYYTFLRRWAKSGLRFAVVKAYSNYSGDNSQRRLKHFLLFFVWETAAFIISKFKGYC